MKRYRRAWADRRNSDEAQALLGVVMISIIIFAQWAIIAAVVLVGITLTSSSRDAVQALNSAEAGRDDLMVSFANGEACTPSGEVELGGLAYGWQIYNFRQDVLTAPTVPTRSTGAGVQAGCPAPIASHTLLKVTGRSGKVTKTITAVFSVKDGAFDPQLLSQVE